VQNPTSSSRVNQKTNTNTNANVQYSTGVNHTPNSTNLGQKNSYGVTPQRNGQTKTNQRQQYPTSTNQNQQNFSRVGSTNKNSAQFKNTSLNNNNNNNESEKQSTLYQFFPKVTEPNSDSELVPQTEGNEGFYSKRKREEKEEEKFTNNSEIQASEDSPQKRIKIEHQHSENTKPVVWFTGFGPADLQRKDFLKLAVTNLGGEVRADIKYDETITHVVMPPNTRTIKSLVALITGKWVVSPDWLDDCHNAKKFLPSNKYGKCGKKSPFEGKTFYLSPSFTNQYNTNSDSYKHVIILLETIGHGIRQESATGADFILVGTNSKESFENGTVFTMSSIVELVLNNYKIESDFA